MYRSGHSIALLIIDCDYQCHTKCLMSVTVPCTKPRKPFRDIDSSSVVSEGTPLFGGDLSKQAECEGRAIPYIITRCVEEVETQGMDYEGIYRKSGGASSLRSIIDAFEAGGDVNFESLAGSGDICAVTSVLKQYLRSLPDPLIPFSSYTRFLQATMSDAPSMLSKFREALASLPKVNYDCLQFLMLHLSRSSLAKFILIYQGGRKEQCEFNAC
jgi:Rho-type GTPase-activating protein 1/2